MKPGISGTRFESIIVGGQTYDHDVVIRLSKKVKKRKKRLSKERYGSSHTVSPEEAAHIYDDGAEIVVVGTGQYGALDVSRAALDYFARRGCEVVALPTPQAVEAFNAADGNVIGMFHVTC